MLMFKIMLCIFDLACLTVGHGCLSTNAVKERTKEFFY
jgi:hypothetical protein